MSLLTISATPQQAAFLLQHIAVTESLLSKSLNLEQQLQCLAGQAKILPYENVQQPQGLLADLAEHQIHGLSFLWHLHRNEMPGFLADEMGLGKTIQALALLQLVDEAPFSSPANPQAPHLIVVPLSTLSNWRNETTKWTNLTQTVFHGDKEQRDILKRSLRTSGKTSHSHVVLTTYESLVQEPEFFQRTPWRYLVLDEGHRAKNSVSTTYQALGKIQSQHRLCISGTPIQNNLVELWSLLALMFPGLFKFASVKEDFVKGFDAARGWCDPQLFKSASAFLELVMLRRTKAELVDFVPILPKREIRLFVPLTQIQKSLYVQSIKDQTADGKLSTIFGPSTGHIEEGARARERLSNLLQHLRKICTHPLLAFGEDASSFGNDYIINASGKFLALNILIRHIVLDQNRKLVIFSSFTKSLDACEKLLYHVSDGGTRFKWTSVQGKQHRCRRNLNLRLFSGDDSCHKVILVSTRAGGEGINLTSARDSIFLDEDWNPQKTLQAEDRTHRMGQTGQVTIYKLCTQGTVEEQMLKRIYKKLYLSAKIMDDMAKGGKGIDAENGNAASLETNQVGQLKASEIKRLIRLGTTALVHGADDANEMKHWDLDALIKRTQSTLCNYERPYPQASEINASDSDFYSSQDTDCSSQHRSDVEDEELFLKSRDDIVAQIFEGQKFGDPKPRRRKRSLEIGVDMSLDRSRRRKGKETTIVNGSANEMFSIGPSTPGSLTWNKTVSQAMVPQKKQQGRQKTAARQTFCIACLTPVKNSDPSCYGCPRTYHPECIGVLPEFFEKRSAPWQCPQHECTVCGQKAGKVGGFTHRCRTCHRGYCDDCIAPLWNRISVIGDFLPEFSTLGYPARESAFYIVCPGCTGNKARQQKYFSSAWGPLRALHTSDESWGHDSQMRPRPAEATRARPKRLKLTFNADPSMETHIPSADNNKNRCKDTGRKRLILKFRGEGFLNPA